MRDRSECALFRSLLFLTNRAIKPHILFSEGVEGNQFVFVVWNFVFSVFQQQETKVA